MPPTTRAWYYATDDDPQGPVPQAELEEMLLSGQLSRATLVWSHPMEDWTSAAEVEALGQAVDPPPPPLPGERAGPPPLEAEVEAAQRSYERVRAGQVEKETAPGVEVEELPAARQETEPATDWATEPRPWRRYFAKMIDVYLFAVAVGILYGLWELAYDPASSSTMAAAIETGSVWLMMPVLALWIPVEAWMLATWHTTPGKWMTGLRVVRPSGRAWSYQDTLHRTGAMVWRGLALGVPLVNLVTMIVAHNKLSKNGVTSWDDDHDFNVAHVGMTAGRWVLLVLAALLILWVWTL